MADEIGALRVSLSIDTAKFTSDIGSVQAMATRLGTTLARNITGALGGLVAGFASASTAINLFNQGVAQISQIDAAAQALGLTTREMQTLAGAAQQSGVGLQDLERIATSFGTRLNSGLRQPMSDISQIMRQLGVEARAADGSMRSFTELLPELADGFARFADDENKTIAATRLFGERAGPEMARFLSQGSAAIAEQREELNRILPFYNVEAVRAFQASQERLRDAIKDMSIEFANMASGPAATFFEGMAATLRNVNQLFGRVLDNVYSRSMADDQRLRQMLAIESQRVALAVEGARMVEQMSAAALRVPDIATRLNDPEYKTASDRLAQIRTEMERLQQSFAALQYQAGQGFDIEGDLNRALDRARRAGLDSLRTMNQQALTEMQAQLQATMTALAGQDPTQSIISQWLWGGQEPQVWTDGFAAAMAEIDRVGRASAQTATQISNQKRALMLREQDLMRDTATLMASTLTTVFKDNKAAAIAAAVINTAVAITKALQLPPPFNWIQAGLIAASGAAQIAAIQSAQPGSGSAPSVGGGAGGDGSGGQPPGQAPTQTLLVQGIDPNAIFTGDQVRALAERIIQYQRDGGVVVVQP